MSNFDLVPYDDEEHPPQRRYVYRPATTRPTPPLPGRVDWRIEDPPDPFTAISRRLRAQDGSSFLPPEQPERFLEDRAVRLAEIERRKAERAGLAERALAHAVDWVACVGLGVAAGTAIGIVTSLGLALPFTIPTSVVTLSALYKIGLEAFNEGQTLGKKLLHLRVESQDGQPASPLQIMARWAFTFVCWPVTLGLGYLMAAGPDKRALHDLLSGTHVVRIDEWEAIKF